ncbi:hypothetical protein RND71_002986 [Anisodus tanguticus]|uniref:KIB1-4 beta-propeller domain-containing protein n=1 Tax=Anisodus tanguticus TaxID=243964 RepID=A0AAE1VWV3_9SOLA|nr:hypothetical protein RND71_002986 [Anisodus tanguticus]
MATLRSIWEEDILIEIMGMIVKKVISISDYVRMSAVCKSWRSLLADHKPSHDLEAPWLLQLKDCAYNDHTGLNFYSLSDSRFYSFKLPNHILNKYPKVARGATFCCATSNGWLILVAGPSHNPDMFLFDPISEIDVKLPPLTTLPSSPYFKQHTIAVMVNMVHIFSITDDSTTNLIVVAAFLDFSNEILAFCNCDIGVTEEERSWEIFDAGRAISCYETMLFNNGVLYTFVSYDDDDLNTIKDTRISDEINHVVVLKPGCCEVKMKLINIVKYNTAHHIRPCDSELHYITDSGLKYVYLAKSITGELLIIWNKTDRLSEHDDAHDDEHDDEEHDDDYDLGIYHTSKLMIERYEGFYKTGKDFESITSLGDQTLFVSPNSNSFSVPARSGNGCQANSIYFTVDALHTLYVKSLTRYRQSGIYCIQEGRIKRPFPNPPLWFQPRLRN